MGSHVPTQRKEKGKTFSDVLAQSSVGERGASPTGGRRNRTEQRGSRGDLVRVQGSEVTKAWVEILNLLLPGCVALG